MARPQRTDPRVDFALAAGAAVLALIGLVAPATTRDRVASALRTTVVAPAAALQARAEISRRSFLAAEGTRRFNDSVAFRSGRLSGVEDENARLRQLLGLAGAVKWGFVPAEILQGRSLGDEYTVTMSAGTSAGVETLSPIIVAQGIVGVVQRADPSLSVGILWPHPDFRVSAMSADGATYGIVTSHQGPSADRYLLELRSVPLRSQLRPGTLIVSDEELEAKLKETKPPQEPSEGAASLPQAPARPPDAKPVVVLDPGHGGIDPGTSSADGITEKDGVRQLAGAGFPFARIGEPIEVLSHGERARLVFLKMKLLRPNFYLLDEPTNHLDIEGQEDLEDQLGKNDVSCLFVSHDRFFTRSVATRFLEIRKGRLIDVEDAEAFFDSQADRVA